MTPRYTRCLIVLGFIGSATPAHAQETDNRVALHGFGSWAFGKTTWNNLYLAGRPEGDFRHTSLAINAAANVDDKVSVHVQGELRDTDDPDHSHVELSYAFAEYRFSDGIRFRIGKVKHPFGLYTEVFNVGTLRPFLDLPQGLYGPVGFAGQSYRGIGITGTADAGAWTASYDVYGGGVDLEKYAVPEEFYLGEPLENVSGDVEFESTRNVVGGRVVLGTPVQGLSFGVSGYTGTLNEEAGNRRTVVAGQLDYRSNRFTLESEIAYQNQVRDERVTGGYIQVAYRLTPEWQVALQYDYLKNTFFGLDPAAAPSLQHHKEGAVAVSYWISRALVLKAEYHRVSGNRLALPDPGQLVIDLAAGLLRTTTNLVQFGGQFSF
jgi:Phosphate-selective porin O and P